MLKWQKGRSGGGYEKLTLVSTRFPIRWDLHIMRMKPDTYVKAHRDPVDGKKHFRLNIILWKPAEGGKFMVQRRMGTKRWWRFTLFRPDIAKHYVSTVTKGTRYVLSIGWAI